MTATVETSVGTYRLQDGRLQVRWKNDDQWRPTEMGYEVHHYPNGGMEIRPEAMPFARDILALVQGPAPSEAPSEEADAERMAILADLDRYEDRSDMPRTWHEGIHWARKIIMQRSQSALRAAPAPPAPGEDVIRRVRAQVYDAYQGGTIDYAARKIYGQALRDFATALRAAADREPSPQEEPRG